MITNGISEFIRHREAECRDRRREEFSLNETIMDEGLEIQRGDAIPARDSAAATLDLTIDLRQAIAELPPHLRELCEHRETKSLLEISRELGIPRHTLRTWLAEVKSIFTTKGLGIYLSVPPAGAPR